MITAPEKLTRLRALRRQVARLERRLQWLERLSHQYSRVRMALVLAGLLTALVGSRVLGEGFGWLTVGGSLVAFLLVAACHGRVKHSIRQQRIWLRLKASMWRA